LKHIVALALLAPALLLATPMPSLADRGDREQERAYKRGDDHNAREAYKHGEDDRKDGRRDDRKHGRDKRDGRDDWKDGKDDGHRGPERDRDHGYGRDDDQIPAGHLPPPGHCRDWIPGRPPGHQPPPYRC
jgi:Ni/Co efflux regulator RcnB